MSGRTGAGEGNRLSESAFLNQSWNRWRTQLLGSTATVAGVSLLIGSGLVGLRLSNQRLQWADGSSASSLAELSGALSLVQSFRGDPSRTPPSLWSERLGVQPAAELWRRYGRSIWWQGWAQDGDAYLILSSSTFPGEIQGLHLQRVGSMEVVASDALHREQLLQRLKAGQGSKATLQPDSLLGACLRDLSEGPGVIWNADALATLSGTLAPLLQQGREGCVQLRLENNLLVWNGVIGRRPLSSLTGPSAGMISGGFKAGLDQSSTSPKQPSPIEPSSSASGGAARDRTLLQVDGQRLDLILGTLLSRQIIQAPLEEHYGINGAMRSRIADLPFSMRLKSLSSGAYKAGLQIQLPMSGSRQQWSSILEAVSDRLLSRNFQQHQNIQDPSQGGASSLWQQRDDPDQTIVGGWQIIKDQSASLLSIGFGTEPAVQPFLAPLSKQQSSALRVTGDPKRLTQLGLLAGLWPKPVQRASALNMVILPLNSSGTGHSHQQSWWKVSGTLTLSAEP